MIKFECAVSNTRRHPATPPKPSAGKYLALFRRVRGARKREVTSPNVKPARSPDAASEEMLLV